MIATNPTRESAVTSQRFEYKYRLREAEALAVRECILPYVNHDSHANSAGIYVLRSLYYDSPDIRLYWSSALGERNRHKLRVRWYGDARPDSTFLEVKRRNDQVIRKSRAVVPVDQASSIVRGRSVEGGSAGVDAFNTLADRYFAAPTVLVRYLREAYSCIGGAPLRITFDRELAGLACTRLDEALAVPATSLYAVPDIEVILEVKFTDTFPWWLHSIVRRLHLHPRSTCKYGLCVEELQRRGFRVGAARADLSIHT